MRKEVITEGLILPNLVASDWRTVIEALGERLLSLNYTYKTYVPAVLEREFIYPTGLPLGEINVAIPHTDTDHVISPAIAVATLKEPVEFGNMGDPDSKLKVGIVFLLAMKDPQAQVGLLQNLVEIFQQKAVIEELSSCTAASAIAAVLRENLKLEPLQRAVDGCS